MFDGDSLSIMAVPSDFTEYVESRIGPDALYYRESSLTPLFTPSHEFLLGLNLGSRINVDKKVVKVTSMEDIDKLLDSNTIDYNTPLNYNNRTTSYGRLVIGSFIRNDLDTLIGTGVNIDAKNILVIMESINVKDDRLEILHKLAKFGSEVVRYKGVTSLTLNDLYLNLDPKLHTKLINIKNDPNLSNEIKLLRINESYQEFTEKARGALTPLIKDRLASSNRIKEKQVLDLSLPKIYIDGKGSAGVMNNNILEGLSPDDYYIDAITNRKIVGIKQAGVGGSGYLTRQLVTIGKGFKFQESEAPVDNYLEMEITKYFLGRKNIEGKEMTIKDIGKVEKLPSCIFNQDINIYQNQVSNLLDFYQDSNIGFSYATSLTEAMTQSVLSIKHNATFRFLIPSFYHKAKMDGKVTEINDNTYTVLYSDGTEEVRPKSSSFVFNKMEFKKGETIGYVHKLMTPTYRFEVISKLITTFPISVGNKSTLSNIQVGVSYSPYEGEIHYEYLNKGKVAIHIDGKLVGVNYLTSPTFYFYAEGEKVPRHARITSDVLSMNNYSNIELTGNDLLKDRYMVFRKQFIEANGEINEDLIEFLYRACSVKLRGELSYVGLRGAFKELPPLSQIAFGYANKALDKLLENEEGEREDPLDIIFRSQLQYNNIL